MERTSSSRLIAWAIALISAVVVWQLDILKLLRFLAISLGIMEGSLLYNILIDGGIPVIFVCISWVVVRLYEDVVWRWLPTLGCKRGWWIYGLIAQHESNKVEIVGFFYTLHTLIKTQIIEGHAFYFEDGHLIPRGNWDADTVWITPEKIRFLFNMHAVNPRPEALPSMYEGYLFLSRTTDKPLTGIEHWDGYFQDIGDRREVAGWVCSERLSPLSVRRSNQAEKVLHEYAAQLIKQTWKKCT